MPTKLKVGETVSIWEVEHDDKHWQFKNYESAQAFAHTLDGAELSKLRLTKKAEKIVPTAEAEKEHAQWLRDNPPGSEQNPHNLEDVL